MSKYTKVRKISGVVDHGALGGLSDDDHPQYFNVVRLAGADIDRGEYYDTSLQNIPDLASKGAAYNFLDASNDSIATGQDLITGFGGFSVVVLAKAAALLDVSPGYALLVSHGIGYGGLLALDPSTNTIQFACYDGSSVKSVDVAFDSTTDQDWHTWSGTVDTTGNGGDGILRLYKDGKLVAYSGYAAIASLSATTNTFNIGGDGAGRSWSGEIARVLTFNVALTAAEVKAFSSGAPVPYSMIGASQTELMPNQVDRDFSGASAWANVDINAYDETGDLTITANAADQYCTCPVASAPTTVGKRYRMTFDVDNLVSTWTVKSFDGTQTLGTVSADGTGTSVEWTAETTGGYRIVSDSNTSSADFDNFTLLHIGCVLQMEQDGIGHGQWQDNSGNEYVGTVSGAIAHNLPVNHQEKYLDLTVTGNTSFTLPKGYQIKSIVVKEIAGNALTGGLDVGFSTNGIEVVSGMAVAGSAAVLCTLIEAGTIGGTFTTADDIIYISDGDDDGNWNSASLELRVTMQRLMVA